MGIAPLYVELSDLRPDAARAAVLVLTGANQEPAAPGVESVDVAQRAQIAPHADKGLLNCVLGSRAVTQDALCDCIHGVVARRGDRVERVTVPRLCAPHQLG